MAASGQPFGTPEAGLAQVMIGETDDPGGMAFLLSPRLAVTCGHVVNVALGRDKGERLPVPEGARVIVRFPLADDITYADGSFELAERRAAVVRFRPPGRLPTDDIALLALDEPAPKEVGESVLAEITGIALDHDELGVFGPPHDSNLVVHYDARFGGRVNPSWSQLDAVTPGSDFVRGGFSGGRVWSYAHEAAIGMVVAMQMSPTQRRAFMIPAAAIRRFLPTVPSELRALWPNFCSVWTVFSTCFFLLVLTHFLGERIGQYPSFLSLGEGNTVVAGFFGMMINAVLMPIAFAMLLRFASSYSEHPWWMRLPRFGWFAQVPRPAASRMAAALTLAFFVAAPLYIQAHFVHMFNKKGDVYIYPEPFGYSSEELEKTGNRCYCPSVHYCTHRDARFFSLVTPKPGYPGGYIDNAYHYGDRGLKPPNSVTFFPILQPLMIYGLSLASLIMAIVLIKRLLRPSSRSSTLACDEPLKAL